MNIGHLQHFISSESNYGKYKVCSLEIKTHRKGDPLPWPAQDSPSMTTTQVPFHSEKRIPIGTTRVFSRSVMSDSLWPQAPVSMRFYRQEYWSGLSYPSPGDLLDPGIKPMSLVSPALAGGFFTTSTTHKTHVHFNSHTTPCPTWWLRLFCLLGAFLWPMAKAAQTDRRKGHIFGDKQGCLLTQLPLVVIL